MPTTSTLNHAGLGKLTGLLKDDVVSFRGIKYASLQSRFAASEPTFPTAPAKEDATKFGPEPLQNPKACAVEWFLIGGECPTEPGVEQDWSGLEGLTLNITTPKNIPTEKKLPVLIFIHGGAFMHGAASWPQYSLTPLVASSITTSNPIIAVSINYRTNIFGFLEHPSLAPNRGINDQRHALDWIYHNISGFGGDNENMTILGQSAGGASVGFHLEAGIAGVKRAVMMSGDPGIRPAVLPEVHQDTFEKVCAALSLNPESAIQELESMSPQDLYKKLPMNLLYLPSLPLPSGTGKPLQAIMVGDSKDDGGILLPPTAVDAKTVVEHFEQLPESFLALYALSVEDDADTVRQKLCNIFSDWVFYVPAVSRAMESKIPAYLYHFNVLNEWDCVWKGQSNHLLDVAHLFGNYAELKDKAVSKDMQEAIVRFVNGDAPWSPREVKVFGSETDERTRAPAVWKIAEEAGGWDKVHGVVMSLLAKI
ncbi:Alpha/Beta hydrolase protein [Pyronema omphalodes]|nr:Alpha/Beta hydrolase protein [Pyronema omphalodes]